MAVWQVEVEVTEADCGQKWSEWIDVRARSDAGIETVARAARKQMIAALDASGYEASDVEAVFVKQAQEEEGW
jgi:hypothetical protein